MAVTKKNTNVHLDFASGRNNRVGLQIKMRYDEDTHSVYGSFVCPDRFQNRDGHIHPGIVATILDEIMTQINRAMNFQAQTSEMSVRYLNEAIVNENLYLRGWLVKKNRQMIENRAEIENEIGKIIARSKGKYLEVEQD